MDALHDKYADKGIENIESTRDLEHSPVNEFGTPEEIVNIFARPANFNEALNKLENELYKFAL